MKKPIQYVVIALMLLSGAFAVWLPFYIWPKEVVVDFDGVMYQEGVSSSYDTVAISINGHINNRLFGGRTYLGKIIIDEMEVRDEWKTQTVKINFNSKGLGVMYYLDEEDSNYSLVPHAYISMGDMGSSIVLSLIGEGDVNTHMFAGSTFIAGPATDRAGAVEISNDLMEGFMEKPLE
jgi:hypothetical protein